MSLIEKVKKLLKSGLQERPDLFLLDVKVSENNNINVIIDGDQGVTIDDIVHLSRHIEHNLDREAEDFALTVSSVDITKPFHLKRQFQKNISRPVKVKTTTGEVEGVLVHVDDNQIVLENKVREPKKIGKGKVTVVKQNTIPFDDIKEAKVVLKF